MLAAIWEPGDPTGLGRIIIAIGIVVAAGIIVLALLLDDGEDEREQEQRILDWFWERLH